MKSKLNSEFLVKKFGQFGQNLAKNGQSPEFHSLGVYVLIQTNMIF
jgi:hypothetical protein